MTETSTVGSIAYQNLSRFKVPNGFRGCNAIFFHLWWTVQATLFRGSPQVFHRWRRWLLRCFEAKVGRAVLIRLSVEII
jgi:putative colanic acid biosynthesis acetyltransferase WcaF